MPDLEVLQSLWAMERRHTNSLERSLEANAGSTADADFAGVSAHWTDRAAVRRLSGLLGERGLVAEGRCFPTTADDLQPVLDLAAPFAVEHVGLQPDVRPRRLEDCVPPTEGWTRLSGEAGIPVHVETHRDRMTTHLHVVLDLPDSLPALPSVADLPHVVVAHELPWPVSEEEQAKIRRVLDDAHALHGRVASREQVQIEISYPHHRPCADLFLGWWSYGPERMVSRLPAGRGPRFTCELGPEFYAITGRDGNDTTDRWAESLALEAMAEEFHAAGARPAEAGGP